MTRILVPPGIGDIYWVLVKLRGFCRAHGIEKPEIWIDAPNDRKRSLEFIERVPFIRAGGYHDRQALSPADALKPMAGWRQRKNKTDPIREEAYLKDGQHAFADVDGFDWFLSFNGSINAGRSLEDIEPQWPVEWDIGLKVTSGEKRYGAQARKSIGPYIVTAFFDAGFYKRWLMEMPASEIYRLLSMIHDSTGRKIVLTGASWDDSQINKEIMQLDDGNDRIVSLIGKTTLEEYFGLLRASDGCIGFPAGNTMMGAVFGKPTSLIWNDFFDRKMHINALPPVQNYVAANTKAALTDIHRSFCDMINIKGH